MTIPVHPPVGGPHPLPPPGDSAEPLSHWLETHGHPLNTRCGGRGLCNGCQIRVESPAGIVTERACQLTASDLPADLTRIQIPLTSCRDASLHGVTVFELRNPGPPPPTRPGVGLALDIGTTTVAGALWDFSTGRCLAEAAVANAQRRHGDNVVARISFSIDHADGLGRLRRALLNETLRPLIAGLCRDAGIAPAAITQAVAAGNPAMLHTLAGASLVGLATFPFHPVFLGDHHLTAADHGLPFACPLDLLPALGPFVGADITAGALASGLLADEPPALLIDFGTNGEILLKHAGGYLATATAAGPAFEGGRLACGAPARPGVISSLTRENGVWSWTLTGGGNGRPAGLSGAAYVDFIALGARDDLINAFGRFNRRHPGVITVADAAPGAGVRVQLTEDLYVSEADVAELLQAKAAIAAGVTTLLELASIRATDLHTLYVAGGFGYHLQPANAQALGLLPAMPLDRIALIGNSSLGGASLLLHPHQRPALNALLADTHVIELNQIASFGDHFTDALSLPD